ncbi:tyrosine recombinase XerC [Clostridium puniceum]|uniref:Tyrosine recombinase XerC n=1 Tax=Clostridium puniceum TaxID=29367 RepID=A0A1S8T8I9_9CLOT|nr:tyrosine-type recombinase/integrase [Clostridium puniceum]OOM73972.1 tyrosine recombinase XerC [Clostridium puniceum]
MFEKLKIGATLYHIVGNDIIVTTVTKIESNEQGIYVYAKNEKGEQYRFILIVYSNGKTVFGDTVWVRLEDYMKASTVNGYITSLKGFFGWLQSEEYIIKNPAFKLKQTKVPRVILQPYTSENLEKLREACETEKEKCLFELLDSTACRISEIDNIKLEDINWQERSIKVLGKGNKERIVYFSTKAKLHMQRYINSRIGESEYLFISDRGIHQHIKVRALQLILCKIKIRAGVEERVHCHKFRRTRATQLLNGGMRIEGVQGILGHTTPATTQIYAQLSQENLKNEYRKLVV